MRVNGKKLTGPRIVKVYLPTGDDEAVEFKFRPLKADENFEKVLSKPLPPQVLKPGGAIHHNENDKNYKDAVFQWMSKKFDWEFLTSISVTEDLQFDTVRMEDPETWKNWRKEIGEHFGDNQINKIFNGFVEAQFVTEETMERAREAFLTGRRVQQEMSPSQTDEVKPSQSGELANESA
jgi:hypothetical protein